MAHREACQLFIEQEIQEGLNQGKTPHSIGKDLAAWVEKLFEAKIPAETLRTKARRMKAAEAGQMTSIPTSPQNSSQSLEKQEIHKVTLPKYVSSVSALPASKPGPGRLPKYTPPTPAPRTTAKPEPKPFSDAEDFAIVAISQLSRIRDEDPNWRKAIERVQKWIDEYKLRRERDEQNHGNK
jgi:hypothetical protein